MNLYFLRHGEALAPGKFSDDERPLSETGQRQADAAGQFFTERLLRLDFIMCSPLTRARQTAEAVQRALGISTLRMNENLLSAADPRAVLQDLRSSNAEDVLLVGHEPHLSRTISLLLGMQEKNRVEMKPCSLASVSTASAPDPGRGVLLWLMPSSEMVR